MGWEPRTTVLSALEAEIERRNNLGHGYRYIARCLGMNPGTVKTHIKRVRLKRKLAHRVLGAPPVLGATIGN